MKHISLSIKGLLLFLGFSFFFGISSAQEIQEKLRTNRFDSYYTSSQEALSKGDLDAAIKDAQSFLTRAFLECRGYKLFSDIYKNKGDGDISKEYNTAYDICEDQSNIGSVESYLKAPTVGEDINIVVLKNYLSVRLGKGLIENKKEDLTDNINYIFTHILLDSDKNTVQDFYAQLLEEDFQLKPFFLHEYFEIFPEESNKKYLNEVLDYENLDYSGEQFPYKSSYERAYQLLIEYTKDIPEKQEYERQLGILTGTSSTGSTFPDLKKAIKNGEDISPIIEKFNKESFSPEDYAFMKKLAGIYGGFTNPDEPGKLYQEYISRTYISTQVLSRNTFLRYITSVFMRTLPKNTFDCAAFYKLEINKDIIDHFESLTPKLKCILDKDLPITWHTVSSGSIEDIASPEESKISPVISQQSNNSSLRIIFAIALCILIGVVLTLTIRKTKLKK